jgi:hypothetical protein
LALSRDTEDLKITDSYVGFVRRKADSLSIPIVAFTITRGHLPLTSLPHTPKRGCTTGALIKVKQNLSFVGSLTLLHS